MLGIPACAFTPATAPYAGPGLKDLAPKGTWFGVAADSYHLRRPSYAAAIAKHANILVPENELKWRIIQPREGEFDFSGYDRLAAFAAQNKMRMRGHTLVWHSNNPPWVQDIVAKGSRADITRMLETHIKTTIAHTTSQVTDWDVVNEAVDPHSPRPDFFRESIWLQSLGMDYLPLAYNVAHKANPKLTLTYNDYSLEYADPASRARRAGVLRLLRFLKREGAPIHQLGLQSHLACHRPLGGDEFTTFLKQVRKLGIKIIVTELDVKLEKITGSDEARLAVGANYTAAYIHALQKVQPIDTLLTWGLSSPYSFMVKKDWETLDPLPLDADMNPLPLWYALKETWLNKKA